MQNSTLTLEKLSDMTRDNVNFNGQGVQATLVAGQASQNIDYLLADDCFLAGGQLNVKNANFGDTFNLQVVDKNNILGFGAGLVIQQFVSNFGVCDDKQTKFDKDLPNVAKIITGLCLRVVYNSTGTLAPQVAINWDLYKAKS